DSTFSTMTWDDWNAVTSAKVQGSWNLHESLPTDMHFFIMLSSMAGIFGNVGQSSCCAGNTYQEVLARYRVSIGEKASSIDLSIVTSQGYVAENQIVMDRLTMLNLFRPLSIREVLALLDYVCNPNLSPSRPCRSQIVTGFESPADIESKGRDVPSAIERPFFQNMRQAECTFKCGDNLASHVRTLRSAFTEATSEDAAASIVAKALKMKVRRVLGLPADLISMNSALDSYGVDLLIGLELRNWLSKESGADLAVFGILGGATLLRIGQMVAAKNSLRIQS
ncbi:KR domain-containing protein, partial [Bipolaris maydis]